MSLALFSVVTISNKQNSNQKVKKKQIKELLKPQHKLSQQKKNMKNKTVIVRLCELK